MEQLGEAVVFLFPGNLVREYEAVQGQLVDTTAAGSSSDVVTAVEASAEATVSTDLTHTPLQHSLKGITSESTRNLKEDVDPSFGNIN